MSLRAADAVIADGCDQLRNNVLCLRVYGLLLNP